MTECYSYSFSPSTCTELPKHAQIRLICHLLKKMFLIKIVMIANLTVVHGKISTLRFLSQWDKTKKNLNFTFQKVSMTCFGRNHIFPNFVELLSFIVWKNRLINFLLTILLVMLFTYILISSLQMK